MILGHEERKKIGIRKRKNMKARYSKFLNAKPKVFGIEILDIYLIFLVWIVMSLITNNEVLKILLPFLTGVGVLYYKKKFNQHYLYFLFKKRKYTQISIGVNDGVRNEK